MWLVTTVLNRAVLGTMRNTDQVSIIWMSWQSARRYYMCPNFSDEENETHRGCMICPKWRSNDCTARSQLCFWWDPMLGTIGLHHHRTWRDGWVEEYKFFGGYSLNSGFFIPTFFFFFFLFTSLQHASICRHIHSRAGPTGFNSPQISYHLHQNHLNSPDSQDPPLYDSHPGDQRKLKVYAINFPD